VARTDFKELGSSGLTRYGGLVYEEWMPELKGLKWRKIVRQMLDNDSTVGAVLFAIEMLCRQVACDVVAADESAEAEREAEFFKQCLFEDLETSWPDTLSEILTFLPHGFSVQEMVFKVRGGDVADPQRRSKFDDGRIGFRKWGARSQDSLEQWVFDDAGRVIAMQQRCAPDYVLRTIPLDKCMHFRTSTRKGNPEGRSVLRNSYRDWYFKTHLSQIEAIGVERDLAGLPVGKLPSEYFNAAASTAQANIFAEYKSIVTNIRRDEQEGVLIPSDRDEHGNALFELQLLSSSGKRQFDTNQIVQRYDQRIAMSVMADFLLIGHTQHSGSFGLSKNKSDLFSIALNAWMDSVVAVINNVAIPKLGKLNAIPQQLWPKLAHDGVDTVDLKELGDYISKLSGANIAFGPQEQAYLKEQAGIPVMEEDAEAAATTNEEQEEPDNTEQEPSE
jgi:hypothetical protein